jgi:hypothetical protein
VTIYARKGERVTCEGGHHIATFARDVMYHEVMMPDMFCYIMDGVPNKIGERLGNCPACGGHFNYAARDENGKPAGGALHIEGEWR